MKYKKILVVIFLIIIAVNSVLPAFAMETDEYIQETEANNDYNMANKINISKMYYGNLSPKYDVDWYKFDVPYASNMQLFFDHEYIDSNKPYWKVSLYDSSLKRVELYAIQGNRSSFEETDNLEKGVYYIKVENNYTTDKQYNFKVTLCDIVVRRIAGESRYMTSLAIANKLKSELGRNVVGAVIITNGKNFPDALAGSYLAGVKEAPILMASEKTKDSLRNFIEGNLSSSGTIYVLGGTGAVPESVLQGLSRYKIKRLSGSNRYETNLLILEEAGVENQDIIVCTGKTFADSLSASATGKPILLLNNKELTTAQKKFLEKNAGNKFYIIGGENAVSKSMESAIKKFGSVKRISGANRYETSVKVAQEFFENPDTVVCASAINFPDGLCGGPLAMNMDAPLILTADGKSTLASSYVKNKGVEEGYVLGGEGALRDETVMQVFQLKSPDEIY